MENKARFNETAFVYETWLNYFNNYLLEHGHISEQEHKKMSIKIIAEVQRHQKNAKWQIMLFNFLYCLNASIMI